MSDNEKRETHAAVITEMREIHVAEFQDFADRLEAAHRRELAQLRAKIDELRIGIDQFRQYNDKVVRECNGKIGNVAALREALNVILGKFFENGYGQNRAELDDNDKQMILAALSEPPRNCEVGTAEEQQARFLAWCRDRAGGHENIPNVCIRCVRDCGETERLCSIAWAQMPYEETEGGAE